MNDKKHIALITTWFPPKKGVAVNRMYAFAKYLSTAFDLTVFTEGEGDSRKKEDGFVVYYLSSGSFINKLKHDTSDSWLRHNLISVLNVSKGLIGFSALKKWTEKAVTSLLIRHSEKPFDLVISSFSPFEPHAVAMAFTKQTGVAWIADMRDEMSKNPFATFGEKGKLIKQEKAVGTYATAITAVSSPILNDFKTLMPEVDHFLEIRNGFDHNLKFLKPVKNKRFTVGYFGNFYGQRKPNTLFKAILNLKTKGRYDIKIEIIGAHPTTFHVPEELKKDVHVYPPVSYLEAVNWMSKMDVNLLIHPAGIHKGVYTGKLFDYISVAKPIIGIVDLEDVAAQLIKALNCGYVADYNTVKEIEKALLNARNDWENGKILHASENDISQFHREKEIKKLEMLISKLTVA